MTEFTLTSPEGQEFDVSGPDAAQEAREAAAQRTIRSTVPGERQEGAATRWGVDIPGKTAIGAAIDIPKRLIYDPLEAGAGGMKEAFETGVADPEKAAQGAGLAMGGIARLPGGGGIGELGSGGGRGPRRPPTPPEEGSAEDWLQLIKDDPAWDEDIAETRKQQEAERAVDKAADERGQIVTHIDSPDTSPQPSKPQEQRGWIGDLMRRPELPPQPTETDLAASYSRASLAPVTEEMLAARWGPQVSSTEISSPAVIPPARGFLGGDTAAHDAFRKYLAPHTDEREFATKYFAGMWSPRMRFVVGKDPYHKDEFHLQFKGPLIAGGPGGGGVTVGSITRHIYPEEGYAYNAFLELNPEFRGAGIAQSLLGNQVSLYRKMDFDYVKVQPGLTDGGWKWPRYGFVPVKEDWRHLQSIMLDRLNAVRGDLDPAQALLVERMIQSRDPSVVLDLARLEFPTPGGSCGRDIGRQLLRHTSYEARLDLKDEDIMRIFDEYVAKRPAKKQP